MEKRKPYGSIDFLGADTYGWPLPARQVTNNEEHHQKQEVIYAESHEPEMVHTAPQVVHDGETAPPVHMEQAHDMHPAPAPVPPAPLPYHPPAELRPEPQHPARPEPKPIPRPMEAHTPPAPQAKPKPLPAQLTTHPLEAHTVPSQPKVEQHLPHRPQVHSQNSQKNPIMDFIHDVAEHMPPIEISADFNFDSQSKPKESGKPPLIQGKPFYTPPAHTEKPVYTPPPRTEKPVYTPPPRTEKPVYTPPVHTERPKPPVHKEIPAPAAHHRQPETEKVYITEYAPKPQYIPKAPEKPIEPRYEYIPTPRYETGNYCNTESISHPSEAHYYRQEREPYINERMNLHWNMASEEVPDNICLPSTRPAHNYWSEKEAQLRSSYMTRENARNYSGYDMESSCFAPRPPREEQSYIVNDSRAGCYQPYQSIEQNYSNCMPSYSQPQGCDCVYTPEYQCPAEYPQTPITLLPAPIPPQYPAPTPRGYINEKMAVQRPSGDWRQVIEAASSSSMEPRSMVYINPAYTKVVVERPDSNAARQILNLYAGEKSAMTLAAAYSYNSICFETDCPQLSSLMTRMATEASLLTQLLGKISLNLGADPKPRSIQSRNGQFWNGSYVRCVRGPRRAILSMIDLERSLISEIKRINLKMRDKSVSAMLRRVVSDAENRINVLNNAMTLNLF